MRNIFKMPQSNKAAQNTKTGKSKMQNFQFHFHLQKGQKQEPVEINSQGKDEAEALASARKSLEEKYKKEIENGAHIVYQQKFKKL